MKTYLKLLIVGIVFVALACAAWKSNLEQSGDKNTTIRNAIIDFVNTSRLAKKDTVFSIQVINVSEKVTGVSIFSRENKLFPDSTTQIGKNDPYFPTRHLEVEGKLFTWHDSTHVITRDLVLALSRYGYIDSLNVDGFVRIPKLVNEDGKKGVNYFFCKNNLLKYRKNRTIYAIGYYDPPKLKCSSPAE